MTNLSSTPSPSPPTSPTADYRSNGRPNRPHRSRWLLVVLPAAAVFGLAACESIVGLDGSGVAETATFEVDTFDEIDVGGAFELEVTVADGPQSVEVTVDDNFVEHLDVHVDDNRLSIGFERGNYDPEITPTAVVSVPDLSFVDVSGASAAIVSGVDSETFGLDISGASTATVDGRMTDLAVDASGASTAVIEAVATTVSVDASGASIVDLDGVVADEAVLDLSGASRAEVGVIEKIGGELSGASTLHASPDSDVSVRTSGASHVDWN